MQRSGPDSALCPLPSCLLYCPSPRVDGGRHACVRAQVVKNMPPDRMYEVLGQLKNMCVQNREHARELFASHPHLALAVMRMQVALSLSLPSSYHDAHGVRGVCATPGARCGRRHSKVRDSYMHASVLNAIVVIAAARARA